MGADMMARTLHLPADTTIDLTAAKATASQLTQQATLEDLRTLLEYGWIADDTLPDDCGHDDLAARAGHLRQLAEQELHQLHGSGSAGTTPRPRRLHHRRPEPRR